MRVSTLPAHTHNICVGRFQPLLIVYVEVFSKQDLILRMIGCHGLVEGIQIVEECYEVCKVGRTDGETDKSSDG